MMLSDVCLSVAYYMGPKSRTERPIVRKTKIGTEVADVTRDSDTTVKVKGQGHRPLYSARRLHIRQRWPWERIRRGKVLLRCVWSLAREALGRPRREERGGGILCRHAHSLFITAYCTVLAGIASRAGLLCPAPSVGALGDDARLSDVCLSRTSGL